MRRQQTQQGRSPFLLKNLCLLFSALGFVLLNSSCGSNHPFRRGGPVPQNKEVGPTKPQPTGTSRPEPSGEPTPQPTELPTLEPTPTPTSEPSPVSLNRVYFETEVLPLLAAKRINSNTRGCALCHGNPAPSFEEASALVVLGFPETSVLFQKATGAEGAGHMRIWQPDSPEALKLIFWISGKAP